MALMLQSELNFGVSLLRQQNFTEPFIFSPLSIALALSLVHTAAQGATKSQIRNVIANGATDEQMEQHYSGISAALAANHYRKTELNIVNHVFTEKQFDIKKGYLERVQQLYNAGASMVDFEDSEETAEAINSFVENKTGGKVREVIKAEAIDNSMDAILINTLYFKSAWLHKFNRDATKKDNFFSSANVKRNIDFMNVETLQTRFAENEDWKVLSLMYTDQSFVFRIFLPSKRFGLKRALAKLDGKTLESLIYNSSNTWLNIQIPKIHIETSLSLRDNLKDLGIRDAFSQSANLSNMADNVSISGVKHRALIDVDESGTKIVATTEVLALLKRAHTPVTKTPKLFRANHPFLFILTKDNHPLLFGLYQ